MARGLLFILLAVMMGTTGCTGKEDLSTANKTVTKEYTAGIRTDSEFLLIGRFLSLSVPGMAVDKIHLISTSDELRRFRDSFGSKANFLADLNTDSHVYAVVVPLSPSGSKSYELAKATVTSTGGTLRVVMEFTPIGNDLRPAVKTSDVLIFRAPKTPQG